MGSEAVIVAAKRTAIGRFNGAYRDTPAMMLGAATVAAVVAETGVDPLEIDDLIFGQVLLAGAGQNPARQTAIRAGLPHEVPAVTVNQVCGGGQRSIHLAAQAIRAGDAEVIVAGGQDNMTLAPHVLHKSRQGFKAGDVTLKDSMLIDGLIDAFNNVHMGVTAEEVARRYQVTREEQDEYALGSQRKVAAAVARDAFSSEVAPVELEGKNGRQLVTADEHPRPQTTMGDLSALKPIFEEGGTVTAGNSSGLNDGAAALIIMSEKRAAQLGLTPMARIASYASAGVDPMVMGLGPVPASRKALERAGWSAADLDLMEINEAFAAQAIAVDREMGWDTDRVNVNGGAIALGHPLGGSGARIVVTLLHEMMRRNAGKGLAAMCIGGGQGVAICLER